MCGRFTLTVNPDQIRKTFPGLQASDDVQPRYNIAPTQPVAVIPNDGRNRLDFFLWGLIPSWAKDPQIGSRLINARADGVAEKPSFRAAFRRRRCLVLADGFYEWKSEAGQKTKTPMYIRMASGKPFGFAGLWEIWNAPDGSQILSCAIITTEPNALMQTIHNRMQVILGSESYAQWLRPDEASAVQLLPLLKPYPAEEMIAYPVSRLVNSPANESPECVLPLV